jgi:archaellum component FlaD/FlaE
MEVDAKIKELEDEFKVLKAEIRNVLLDIREVILERTNPLAEDHQSAFIRMDLNTTARAMASEAAAHEAARATDSAPEQPHQDTPDQHTQEHFHDEQGHVLEGQDELPPLESAQPEGVKVILAEEIEAAAEAEAPEPVPEASPSSEPPADAVHDDDAGDEPGQGPVDEPTPKVIRRDLRQRARNGATDLESDAIMPTEIPPMYQVDSLPLSGTINISEWLTYALDNVGPKELERIIAIHRLWGNMPPNISRALAYLQELLSETEENDPPWLKVMQDLDKLASL